MDVPEDVLVIIYHCLNQKDQWQLLLSNNTIKQELQPHRYYSLNKAHSHKFYEDEWFRTEVLRKIQFPRKQLALQLQYLFGINIIANMTIVKNVHTLSLTYIDDVSDLGGVHTLNLYYCRMTDVSALKTVHTLTLHHCRRITDVSALKTVHTLTLSYCPNLTDVSALGGVHTLTLSYCPNLTDVSALGGVHTLTVAYCPNVTDVSALERVLYI